jgi:hypothetical protein
VEHFYRLEPSDRYMDPILVGHNQIPLARDRLSGMVERNARTRQRCIAPNLLPYTLRARLLHITPLILPMTLRIHPP